MGSVTAKEQNADINDRFIGVYTMDILTLIKDGKETVYKAENLHVVNGTIRFCNVETNIPTAADYESFDSFTVVPYKEPVFYGVLFDHKLREFKAFKHGERGGTGDYVSELGVTVINNFFSNPDDADLLAIQYNDVRI